MYTTLSGKEISLSKKIAKGGEGEVFEILGNRGSCIKIYHKHIRSKEKEEKLKYMVLNPPSDLQGINYKICWPKDVIYKEGEFVGFMMYKAFDDSLLPYHLCQPLIPKKLSNQWHTTFNRETIKGRISRLKLSVNIVAVVNRIHNNKRYIIVDLKPQNLLVTAFGKVSIIDMDSVQIVQNEKVLFKAPVSTPEYTPPEASDIIKSKIPITKDWDTFSLGVLVYEILCGIHPYVGSVKPPFDNLNTIQEKIKENLTHITKGESVFLVLPTLQKTFYNYSVDLKNIFKRIFCPYKIGTTVRPSLEEFGETLFDAVSLLEEELKKEEQNRLQQEKAKKKIEEREAIKNYKKLKETFDTVSSDLNNHKSENITLKQKLNTPSPLSIVLIIISTIILIYCFKNYNALVKENDFLKDDYNTLVKEKNSQKDLRNSETPIRKSVNKVLSKTQNKPNPRKNSQAPSVAYLYKTTFDGPFIKIPLRLEPNVNSSKLYSCPKDATVYVLNESNETYYKVSVDGYTGFVASGLLIRKPVNKVLSKTQNKPNPRKKSQGPSVAYLYKTTFDGPFIKIPLRLEPNVNSSKLYSCPKDATVYVLNESNETYYKVSVDGYTGFVASGLLKKN